MKVQPLFKLGILQVLLTTGNITIQANQVPSAGFKLPFDTTAALLGAVSGVVILMVAVVLWRAVTERTPSTATDSKPSISRIEKGGSPIVLRFLAQHVARG